MHTHLKTRTWVHYRHSAVTGAVYLGNRSGDAESASGRSAVSRTTAFDAGIYVHVFALLVGIPSGILLSRPAAKGFAEYVMQIFNVGNTLPPLAVGLSDGDYRDRRYARHCRAISGLPSAYRPQYLCGPLFRSRLTD